MKKQKCVILTKHSYRQGGFSTGLLRILDGLDSAVRAKPRPGFLVPEVVTLTSGSDSKHNPVGAHMPPRFEGIDVRSKTGFANSYAKRIFLRWWILRAEQSIQEQTSDFVKIRHTDGTLGYKVYTKHFFGHLKHEGERNEHFHVQVRKGRTV